MTAPPPSRRQYLRPPRPRDAKATRSRLIRAALDLFTSQGFRGTTTPEIAQRAGVAEATIYRHFPGKDALLSAACIEAQGFGRALVATEETEPDRDTRAALGRVGRRLVEGAERDPALLRMLLRPPEEVLLQEPARRAMREFRGSLEQVVAAGKQRGQVRPGSAELWAAVWLALAGFVVERVASRDWTREHPNVEQAMEAAWEAIAYRRAFPEPVKVTS
jgi:AcrR family transcriptional regulator